MNSERKPWFGKVITFSDIRQVTTLLSRDTSKAKS
jgi:hypothetical protein